MIHIKHILAERIEKYSEEHRKTSAVKTAKSKAVKADTQVSYQIQTSSQKTAKTISADNFLRLPLIERLPLITNPTVSPESLQKGDIIHFDFHGNTELELHISLAEVFPKTVRKASIGRNIGSRSMMTGEYLTDTEKRLFVCNGTAVKIEETDKAEHVLHLRQRKMKQVVKHLNLEEFLNLLPGQRLQLVTKMTKNPMELQKGDILVIDFHENEEIESHISLNDILPDTVRAVEVTNNKGKKMVGKRTWCRFFMTENEQRIPILTGYKVKILDFSLEIQ